jgi:hypothetical protein
VDRAVRLSLLIGVATAALATMTRRQRGEEPR